MGEFDVIDPVLTPWAKERGVQVFEKLRDDDIRVMPLFDPRGNIRGYIWFDTPTVSSAISLHVGALVSPGGKTFRIQEHRSIELAKLRDTLDEFWAMLLSWNEMQAPWT